MAKKTTPATSFRETTDLFAALCDDTRLRIVQTIAKGAKNVSDICTELSLAQPTVSHHLGILRMHKLVIGQRHGKQVEYQLHAATTFTEENYGKISIGIKTPTHTVLIEPKS